MSKMRFGMKVNRTLKIAYRKGLIKTVKDRGGLLCHLCWREIVHPGEVTVDHIIPLSVGGQNISENWQPAHERCNKQKGSRVLPELTAWLPTPKLKDES